MPTFTIRLDETFKKHFKSIGITEWAARISIASDDFPRGNEPYFDLDEDIVMWTGLEKGTLYVEGRPQSRLDILSLGYYDIEPKEGAVYVIDGRVIKQVRGFPMWALVVAGGVGLAMYALHRK